MCPITGFMSKPVESFLLKLYAAVENKDIILRYKNQIYDSHLDAWTLN